MVYAIVTVLILIADQLVKFLVTKNIPLNDYVEAIPGLIRITNIHNYGAAFGSLSGARWILVAVSLVFVIAIIVLISQEIIHTTIGKWTCVMVLAGALGNCIDRVLYGYVVDMFEFEFVNFAVFNVADVFITICGIIFCIHLLLHNEPEEVKKANEPEFVRRRREEREAKEAPYAAIPKRGEHKTLEEELRASNPDDPFGEWEFGAEVKAPEVPTPAAPETPMSEESAPEAPVAPVPEKTLTAPADTEAFSLDDILSEFGDL